jgi:hypothetical protein
MSREEQDVLIGELFAQNERLAHRLLAVKAEAVAVRATLRPTFFAAGVES